MERWDNNLMGWSKLYIMYISRILPSKLTSKEIANGKGNDK